MSPTRLVDELQQNIEVVAALVEGVDDELAQWRESPDRWSLVEVIAHLADEEREDFRTRTRLTLESPETDWPPIHPPRWVVEREYQKKSLVACLDDLRTERTASIAWLRSLNDPDWSTTYYHPKLGSASARFLLANWVAHDLHHIRQIVRWKYRLLDSGTEGISLWYAGEW